jgi:CRP/FNR family nitrogen fixation transcriptional regulator
MSNSSPNPDSTRQFRPAIAVDADHFMGSFCYKEDAEIYGENDPAEYLYQIVRGAVRSYKMLSDGRRQIGAFHLAGDIFGFENGTIHRFTTEAVVETQVRFMKRRSLEAVANRDLLLAHDLLKMTTGHLQHAEEHMLLLGRKNSIERVAAFLLEMDRRLMHAGFFSLPMNRRDIADYLGLTLETVSRALSHFQTEQIVAFIDAKQRQIVLLDRKRLAELNA